MLLCAPSFCKAQDSPNCESIKYDSVMHVENATQKQLYERARLWFANTFKDAKEVIQISDAEKGELVGKGAFSYSSKVFVGSAGTLGTINFTAKIYVKEGRYKYEFNDFHHEGSGVHRTDMGIVSPDCCPDPNKGMKGWQRKVLRDCKEQTERHMETVISTLIAAMNKPTEGQKDNW